MPQNPTNTDLGSAVLAAAMHTFTARKSLAERAIAQLADDQLHVALHPETNSIAVIIKHLAGNMLSRWTDLLGSDGEKPGRNRDQEFVEDRLSRAELMARWERGWACLFAAINPLKPEDLTRTIRIRGEAHTVILAIQRQIDHYGYHVGQIVLIARILAGDRWTTLSIPRGQSEQYNLRAWKRSAAP